MIELEFGVLVRVRVKGTPRFRPLGFGVKVGVIIRVKFWGYY